MWFLFSVNFNSDDKRCSERILFARIKRSLHPVRWKLEYSGYQLDQLVKENETHKRRWEMTKKKLCAMITHCLMLSGAITIVHISRSLQFRNLNYVSRRISNANFSNNETDLNFKCTHFLQYFIIKMSSFLQQPLS